MQSNTPILTIALPVPLRKTFDYLPPAETETQHLAAGMRVETRFGNQTLIGVIVKLSNHTDAPVNKLKSIGRVIDETPCLPKSVLNLCFWASNYYQHPLGEVLFAALPNTFRQGKEASKRTVWRLTPEGKGLSEINLKRSPKQREAFLFLLQHNEIDDDDKKAHNISTATLNKLIEKNIAIKSEKQARAKTPKPRTTGQEILKEPTLSLNEEQTTAFKTIEHHHFGCYLLNGVTGSGKTEVYLQLIHRALLADKKALILVPEIGLTHQTIARLSKRFNVKIAELHSNVSDKQRTDNWIASRDGQAQIIIGTRLAALTPIPDLGIIIIDEEHDQSYKQQEGFKYSARDMCIYRAKQEDIPIVLGSATPSLESINNTHAGRFTPLYLTKRAGEAEKPIVEMIDLKSQSLSAGISQIALDRISETLSKGKQAMIFINRRGYAPVVQCHNCGWIANCRACSSSLTIHKFPRHLHCHHCDRQQSVPLECPECQSTNLTAQGIGTEQTEEFLSQKFPNIPVLRFDRDNTRLKGTMEKQLNIAQQGTACILVGTQMLAKGHHLPNLELVVILDTDQGLFSADFRGSERMGQLVTQVAGRSGREKSQGKVLIQSYHPKHPLMELLLFTGYQAFAESLLQERRNSLMPPYWHQVTFRAESKRPENAIEMLTLVKQTLWNIVPAHRELHYLGPLPDRLEKMNERYRFTMSVKASNRLQLHNLIKQAVEVIDQHALAKRTRWSIDVDPLS